MKLLEQIEYEDNISCVISFEVNDDGTLEYDREQWSKVEPKIRAGWSKSVNVFDVLCTVYFTQRGWIKEFSFEVEKKKPARVLKVKTEDIAVEIQYDAVVAELGGLINKQFKSVIKDISEGFLPRILEEFEGDDLVQLKVDVAFAKLEVTKLKFELELAEHRLKEAVARLKQFKENGVK